MLQNGIGVTQGVLRHGVVLPHTGVPQIVGSMVEGAVLNVVGVKWPVGTVVTRRWFRVGVTNPVGTNLTYTIGSGDPDGTLFVEETGAFRGYTSKLYSAATPLIAHGGPPLSAPQPIVAPVILGDPTVGQVLTVSVGQWDANPAATFVATWQRLVGASWVDIVDGLTRTASTADVDSGPNSLRARVVATNSEGSTPAYTPTITVVPYVPPLVKPVNIEAPTITGVVTEGEILTLNIGVWAPTPDTVVYEWLRDDVVIPGADKYQYQLGSADVAHHIKGRVTGGNSDGSNVAITDPTPLVKAAAPPNTAPVNAALPRLLGAPIVGVTLAISPGQWSGFPAPTFTYEVFAGTTSRGIVAASAGYKIVDADHNLTLTVKETASNGVGANVTVTSLPNGPVHSVEPPAIFTLGINLSGMEYSDENSIDVYAITIPDSQLDEVKAKGFTDIRLPIKWDRIERSENRDVFDTVNWGNVIDAITRIRSKGLKCMPDIHNFGARVVQLIRESTPVNETNFQDTGWTHYGATDAPTGFLEDNSNGDHDTKFDWNATGPGTATITVVAKSNPAYTGNGSYKINLLGNGTEVGFRIADGVKFSGNAANGNWSSSGPDSDGYRTFTLTHNVAAAGTATVNIGAGASSGAYSGNHYQGVTGQQPLLIKSIRVDHHRAEKFYKGIGQLLDDGTDILPPSDLARTWSRIVTDIRARGLEDAISAWDLMNEPNSVDSPELWFQAAQLAIYAIRATGSTLPIMVEGKPYSGTVTFPEFNANLPALIDPADNLIFSGHCYGDYDNSGAATGTPMTWLAQGGHIVEIPVNPPGDPSEVVDEMTLVRRCDHMLQWLKTKGFKRLHIGELGIGKDSIHWNNQLRNLIDWAQTNGVWLSFWAGGPAWGDYYDLRWTTYSDGLQAEQMAVVDELMGNPAPTIYRTTMPTRLAAGQTKLPIMVKYNGLIASPITFTAHCDEGGSFAPATLTTDVTENYVGAINFTPPANTNGFVYFTNNKGLTNPAPLAYSSYADVFTLSEAEGIQTNRVFSVWRRRYKSYTGPLVRLWKQVAGVAAEQDFGRGAGVETVDLAAIATWKANADGGIVKVSKIYDQGPAFGLLSSTNIGPRQVTDGGWAAPSAADYPLWIHDAGDGKPVARWTGTGTSSMDFGDSMLNRSNVCVMGVIKHNGGWNDLNWQFSKKFMVFPSYVCEADGASYSYDQQNGVWSHFIAGRHRNSPTGTVGWLNGIETFKGPTLDNTIQYNPDGIHGPDYREQCELGYYRFTPNANLGTFDLREIATLSDIPSDTVKGDYWDDANDEFGVAIAAPVLIDPYVPTFTIDFLTGKEYHNGVEVPAGSYWTGGKTLDDALKGMRFTTSTQGKGIIGAMRDAVFSDGFTFRMSVNDFTGAGSGGTRLNVLTRDGTPWIYNYFARLNGHITANDVYPSNLEYPLPPGAGIVYSGTDQTMIISRGKGRKVTVCATPNSVPGPSQHDASNDPPLATPAILQIGDNSVGGATTFTGYISRIDVWNSDIQDIRQIALIANRGSRYGYVKGPPLPEWHNGQNLSGMENNPPAGPFEQEIDYYSGLSNSPLNPGFGVDLYRLPFSPDLLWDHWGAYINDHTKPFPTAANTTVATMNPTVRQQIQRLITYAQQRQKIVLLDWHGYGGPMGKSLGGTFPNDLFAAVWSAVASIWNGPYVHYDMQNEPVGAASPAGLAGAYQAAVTAIRAIPAATGDIHLAPSDNYSKPYNFDIYQNANPAGDAMLAVTDPLDRLVYHIHYYFDASGSGTGYTQYAALTALIGAVDWARKNHKRLFIGEWGATYDAANNPGNDREGRWLNWYMAQNNDVILGHSIWGGGIYWYEGYWTWTWPKNWNTISQTDRSQMAYLKLYPGSGYVAPVNSSGPPNITASTPIDISELSGATGNTYQLDVRVDPANPQRVVVTGKYGPSTSGSVNGENNGVAIVTNDRFGHATPTNFAGVGDPDSTFDKDGNAYMTTLDRGAGGGLTARKKIAGGLTWSPAVPIMGFNVDHPHVFTDNWIESPFYGRMYAAGRGGNPNFTWSDDGWQTYHVASVGGQGRFNAGFIFSGVAAVTGEAFFSYKSAQTIAVQNGTYAGSVSDFYVIKTTNGGANWRPVYVYTTAPVANPGEDGYFACSNVGYMKPTAALPQGRLFLIVVQDFAGNVARGMLFTSDDLGETWSASGRYIGDIPGKGMLCPCFSSFKNGTVVLTWMATQSRVQAMWAMATRDGGVTWSAPKKISADWSEPVDSTQNRTPSQDQLYAGPSLADNTVEVVWPQNIGSNTYHAFRSLLTIS